MISDSLNETEKHFTTVKIGYNDLSPQNYFILNESSFWDITFDRFEASNLKLISSHAFGKSSSTIKRFFCYNKCGVEHAPPEYDVWKALSNLVNVESIDLQLNVTEIPTHAFRPISGIQKKLNDITIRNHNNRLTVKKMAFEYLDNLKSISFHQAKMTLIENQSLAHTKNSSNKFQVNFFQCQFDEKSFVQESFDGIQRSFVINFYDLHLSFIPEQPFKSVINNGNKITLNGVKINCFDCRNQWMIKEKKQQIKDAFCMHNKSLTLFSSQVEFKLHLNCDLKNSTEYYPCLNEEVRLNY